MVASTGVSICSGFTGSVMVSLTDLELQAPLVSLDERKVLLDVLGDVRVDVRPCKFALIWDTHIPACGKTPAGGPRGLTHDTPPDRHTVRDLDPCDAYQNTNYGNVRKSHIH